MLPTLSGKLLMIEYCTHGTAQCGCGGLVKSVRDAQAEAVSRSYSIGPLCSISNGTTLEDAKERTFDMSDDFKNLCELMATEISSVVETKKHAESTLKEEPTSETRVVDPKTGGAKGQKDVQMSMVPVAFLEDLGRLYAFGVKKYDRNNWKKGYKWSLTVDALFRHLFAVLKGEWLDKETGLPHIVAVGWHCIALHTFYNEQLGTDDVGIDRRNVESDEFIADGVNVIREAFMKGS